MLVSVAKPIDTWRLLFSCLRTLPAETVFAGRTAAWIHGLSVNAVDPIAIVIPPRIQVRRVGVFARRCNLPPEDFTKVRSLPVTMLHRTLGDLCITETPVEALVVMDMALRKQLTDCARLSAYASSASGRRNVRTFRRLVRLAAPADSPMETRLRWLLLEAGLPSPEVQVDLHDEFGGLLGRADLCYPKARLVIEFDGGYHRDRLVSDDRRQNLLTGAGYKVLRFTSPDVYERPPFVADQVRGALLAGPS